MSTRIMVTTMSGPRKGRAFVFSGRTLCTVGRSGDCLLRIPSDDENLTVSRRHCLLDIDPPSVWVRDLGSLNGTFVNNRVIGRREKGTLPGEPFPADREAIELHDGDRLIVGSSEFLIAIQNSAPECEPDALAGHMEEEGGI